MCNADKPSEAAYSPLNDDEEAADKGDASPKREKKSKRSRD